MNSLFPFVACRSRASALPIDLTCRLCSAEGAMHRVRSPGAQEPGSGRSLPRSSPPAMPRHTTGIVGPPSPARCGQIPGLPTGTRDTKATWLNARVVRMLCRVPSDRLYSVPRPSRQHQVGGGGLRYVYAAGRRPLYRLKTPQSTNPDGAPASATDRRAFRLSNWRRADARGPDRSTRQGRARAIGRSGCDPSDKRGTIPNGQPTRQAAKRAVGVARFGGEDAPRPWCLSTVGACPLCSGDLAVHRAAKGCCVSRDHLEPAAAACGRVDSDAVGARVTRGRGLSEPVSREVVALKPCRHHLYDCRSDSRSRVALTRGGRHICPRLPTGDRARSFRRPDTVGCGPSIRTKDEN
jgi:hypothetical protein